MDPSLMIWIVQVVQDCKNGGAGQRRWEGNPGSLALSLFLSFLFAPYPTSLGPLPAWPPSTWSSIPLSVSSYLLFLFPLLFFCGLTIYLSVIYLFLVFGCQSYLPLSLLLPLLLFLPLVPVTSYSLLIPSWKLSSLV